MAVPVYQSVSASSKTAGNDPVPAAPSGTVNGSILVAIGVATGGASITAPSGDGGAAWNTHANSLGTDRPLWWKKCNGTEPASYTFVTSGVTAISVVAIIRVTGVVDTAPIEDASGASGTGALTPASVTSGGAARLLFGFAVKGDSTISWTQSGYGGGFTEHFDASATTASRSYAGGSETVGSGATGTRTWTPSSGGNLGVAYSILLQPIPPKTGTFTGAYDFTGSGFTGVEGAGEGSFTGAYDFTGTSFAGQEGPGEALFAGGYDFAGGPFVGEAPGVSSGAFTGSYDFTGGGFVGEKGKEGSFTGGYDFTGAFTGSAPSPTGLGDIYPGGRDRFTARRTPKNRRRVR